MVFITHGFVVRDPALADVAELAGLGLPVLGPETQPQFNQSLVPQTCCVNSYMVCGFAGPC